MVLLGTVLLTTAVLAAAPVTISGTQDTHGDHNAATQDHSVIGNASDLVYDSDDDVRNGNQGGLQLVGDQGGLQLVGDSDNGQSELHDDGGGVVDLQQQGAVDDEEDTYVDHGEVDTYVDDEEVDTYVDEELQQDPPDVWSDTGQFLPGVMDTPTRVVSPSEDAGMECPPPAVLVTPSLCGAPACLTHRHCRDPETACCFNGCVHTCLRPLDAPAVIDWLEDTSLLLPMLDEAPDVPRLPILFEGSSSIAYAQGGGEAVHLQGGCTITSQQYNQLKDFMTRTTIQDCSCTGGEVVCAVKPYKADEE